MHRSGGILSAASSGAAAGSTRRTCISQAPTGRCAPSAAELASRPTPAALRLFQSDLVKSRNRPDRRVVRAQAALTAAPSQTRDQTQQNKDHPVQVAPGNGQVNSHASQNSQDSPAPDTDSQVCQAESLTLLEWPEICQQVKAKAHLSCLPGVV